MMKFNEFKKKTDEYFDNVTKEELKSKYNLRKKECTLEDFGENNITTLKDKIINRAIEDLVAKKDKVILNTIELLDKPLVDKIRKYGISEVTGRINAKYENGKEKYYLDGDKIITFYNYGYNDYDIKDNKINFEQRYKVHVGNDNDTT